MNTHFKIISLLTILLTVSMSNAALLFTYKCVDMSRNPDAKVTAEKLNLAKTVTAPTKETAALFCNLAIANIYKDRGNGQWQFELAQRGTKSTDMKSKNIMITVE